MRELVARWKEYQISCFGGMAGRTLFLFQCVAQHIPSSFHRRFLAISFKKVKWILLLMCCFKGLEWPHIDSEWLCHTIILHTRTYCKNMSHGILYYKNAYKMIKHIIFILV